MINEVQAAIDRQPVRRKNIVVLAFCTFLMMMDGFDIYMIGQIAPAIAKDMNESQEVLTKVFLIQQIGLAIGGFVVSPIADRYGRRPLIILCSICFGGLTFAAAFSTTLLQLGVLRGLAGVFLAGAVPNALALITESTPARLRSTFVAVAFGGFVMGSGVAAIIALFFVADYGWQSCFIVGGAAPILFSAVAFLYMNESVAFLVRKNPSAPRTAAMLGELIPDFSVDAALRQSSESQFLGEDVVTFKDSVRDIVAGKWLVVTVLVWSSFFLCLGMVAMFAAWSATFFNHYAGVTVPNFATINLFHVIGSFIGTISSGALLDRFKPTQVAFFLPLAAAISLALVGIVPFGGPISASVFFAWGFSQIGTQAALNVISTQLYPTAIRSTGVGWAFGAGRIGSIVGPLLGGAALTSAMSLEQIFLVAAAIQLLVLLLLVALAKRMNLPSIISHGSMGEDDDDFESRHEAKIRTGT